MIDCKHYGLDFKPPHRGLQQCSRTLRLYMYFEQPLDYSSPSQLHIRVRNFSAVEIVSAVFRVCEWFTTQYYYTELNLTVRLVMMRSR
jgi:hypothetical protein